MLSGNPGPVRPTGRMKSSATLRCLSSKRSDDFGVTGPCTQRLEQRDLSEAGRTGRADRSDTACRQQNSCVVSAGLIEAGFTEIATPIGWSIKDNMITLIRVKQSK